MRVVVWESLVTMLIAAIVLIAVVVLGILAISLTVILAAAALLRQLRPARSSEPRVLVEAREVAAAAWRRGTVGATEFGKVSTRYWLV
jgi:hypothetical protein